MIQKLFVALALVGLTGTVAVLSADDASKASSGSKADHMFASCVAVGNQEEIIIAELGIKKAHSDDVKKFAEMMVADHHAFLLKLKKFAPEATQPGFLGDGVREARSEGKGAKIVNAVGKILQTAASDADDKPDAKKGVETAAATRSADAGKGDINFLDLQKEMANECLALTRDKLSAKSGAGFDECFMGQQVGMHLAMKAKLTVFHRHASGELAEILADGLKTTDQHLAKAEHLMKTISHQAEKAEKREVRKELREIKEGVKENVKEGKEEAAKEKE
jgi:predicted outer membrane protein